MKKLKLDRKHSGNETGKKFKQEVGHILASERFGHQKEF